MPLQQSCRVRINNRLKMFTAAESKVANYVLEHYDQILNYTITELAEKAGASDASVVRFCKGLGYKGYQDFKINAAKDVIPHHKHLNPVLDHGDDTASICRKVFESEIAALSETLQGLDVDMVERAAQAIAGARRIELVGSGGSALVGMDAHHKFLKIGIKVSAHTDADIQAMSASLLEPGDAIIGISHSGSNRNVVRCMQLAREKGVTCIVMTTEGRSPMVKMADIVLFTATKETAFKSESVSARIAQLAVVDALVASVAFKNYDRSYEAIQMTRKATSSGKF